MEGARGGEAGPSGRPAEGGPSRALRVLAVARRWYQDYKEAYADAAYAAFCAVGRGAPGEAVAFEARGPDQRMRSYSGQLPESLKPSVVQKWHLHCKDHPVRHGP